MYFETFSEIYRRLSELISKYEVDEGLSERLLKFRQIMVTLMFWRAVKPVYNYGLRLEFGGRFRYLYSNNLTLEK